MECTFCLRKNAPGVAGSPSLWLEREPAVDEIKADLDAHAPLGRFKELVFCGYGEPTVRLEELLEAARYAKSIAPGLKVRVNTNGLADLVHGKRVAPLFAGVVDVVSVSLNTSDPVRYLDMCRPRFGASAYPAMLAFTRECAEYVPEVVMTVVGEPVTDAAEQERCRKIAEACSARLRIRAYEG